MESSFYADLHQAMARHKHFLPSFRGFLSLSRRGRLFASFHLQVRKLAVFRAVRAQLFDQLKREPQSLLLPQPLELTIAWVWIFVDRKDPDGSHPWSPFSAALLHTFRSIYRTIFTTSPHHDLFSFALQSS